MGKVLYLLGAGASANALPVIGQIGERISIQREWLLGQRGTMPPGPIPNCFDIGYDDAFSRLQSAMDQLHAVHKDHDTIDTYAKKLYLSGSSGREKVQQLKAALTLFFAIEQFRCGFDRRYEGFLASIMKPGTGSWPQLHDDVIILTWNYDQQLLLGLNRFCQTDHLNQLMRDYKVKSLLTLNQDSRRDFKILHLNGIAGYNWQREDYPLFDSPQGTEITGHAWNNMLRSFIHTYHREYRSRGPRMLLDYSWEAMDDSETPWQQVQESIADCSVLVSIGYSFHHFNRPADKKVLGHLPLERVYVQSKGESAHDMVDAFRHVRPDVPMTAVHAITKAESFYVPPDL